MIKKDFPITNQKTSSLTVEWRLLSTTKFDAWNHKFRCLSCSWLGQCVADRSHHHSALHVARRTRIVNSMIHTVAMRSLRFVEQSAIRDICSSSPFIFRQKAMRAVIIVLHESRCDPVRRRHSSRVNGVRHEHVQCQCCITLSRDSYMCDDDTADDVVSVIETFVYNFKLRILQSRPRICNT